MIYISCIAGLQGTIFCVGTSPADLQAEIRKELSILNGECAIRETVTQCILRQITGKKIMNLKGIFDNIDWKQKLQCYMQKNVTKMPYTFQYVTEIIEAYYLRIIQIRDYHVEPKCLHSQLVLLKAQSLQTCDLNATKNAFQRHSQKSVAVYEMQSSLPCILQNPICPTIINRHLKDDIQEAFKELNQCITYFK